ncbi:MAG: putative protease [Oscillospiraceae bacterium]|nr:putative protease [Oscillospiraceae bacterium]
MNRRIGLNDILLTVAIAAVLWFLMFVIQPINFWLEMSLSIFILLLVAYFKDHDVIRVKEFHLRYLIIGITSAMVLYGVFYVGNILSGLLFSFKDAQIALVYGNKTGTNPYLISALLLFLIGPGEELFWRGFVQKNLSTHFGNQTGFILGVMLYTAVHIVTGNVMLVIAAFVCGIFWGWIYQKEKNLTPVIISHCLWDVTVFVLLPLQ